MQPRPTAEEILRDVAALLDDVLVPALSGPAQHQARGRGEPDRHRSP